MTPVKPRVRTAIEVTFQPRAECTECDWKTHYSPQAKTEAKQHAMDTGHIVQTVRETWTEYERIDP